MHFFTVPINTYHKGHVHSVESHSFLKWGPQRLNKSCTLAFPVLLAVKDRGKKKEIDGTSFFGVGNSFRTGVLKRRTLTCQRKTQVLVEGAARGSHFNNPMPYSFPEPACGSYRRPKVTTGSRVCLPFTLDSLLHITQLWKAAMECQRLVTFSKNKIICTLRTSICKEKKRHKT